MAAAVSAPEPPWRTIWIEAVCVAAAAPINGKHPLSPMAKFVAVAMRPALPPVTAGIAVVAVTLYLKKTENIIK